MDTDGDGVPDADDDDDDGDGIPDHLDLDDNDNGKIEGDVCFPWRQAL